MSTTKTNLTRDHWLWREAQRWLEASGLQFPDGAAPESDDPTVLDLANLLREMTIDPHAEDITEQDHAEAMDAIARG